MATIPAEQIAALANAVGMWRMQEYIVIPFYCLYVYYVLTTIAEEVSIVLPQKWNRGKMLYMVIRHGLLVYIALQLAREYRNYFTISPMSCKGMLILYDVIYYIVLLACDFSLGLCLGALLRTRALYLAAMVILSCAIPAVNAVISLISIIQYRAEPVNAIFAELGYPCYVTSSEEWADKTTGFLGRDIRSYVNLATTTLLATLGAITLVVRYKGHGGHLVQVIRRDGGLHYLSLLAIRLTLAILRTPAVMLTSEVDASPLYLVATMGDVIVVPMLAQRLLINLRKIDYMGSQPVASKLLFAPPAPGSEDDTEWRPDSIEMEEEHSGPRHQEPKGGESKTDGEVEAGNKG